jgi:hypothetical protein
MKPCVSMEIQSAIYFESVDNAFNGTNSFTGSTMLYFKKFGQYIPTNLDRIKP